MYYIGVDLGGTSVKVGLVTETYEIIERAVAPTGNKLSAEAIFKTIADLCKEVMAKRNLEESEVRCIGIGSPGIILSEQGMIQSASNLNFDNVDVRAEMKKHTTIDVFIENDANAAALGEAICGAAAGEESVVVVTLGTGVGGGIITNGKIYRGAFGAAGEIGHQVLQMGGTQCGCGRKGCFEQYASASALISQAKEAARLNPNTEMIGLAENDAIEAINAKVVFDAANAGDEVATNVLDQYFQYIAHGITNLINVLEPKMVVIGGGVSAQKEKLTNPITKYVQDQMYAGVTLKTAIKAAELGNDAGIIGAAFAGTRM